MGRDRRSPSDDEVPVVDVASDAGGRRGCTVPCPGHGVVRRLARARRARSAGCGAQLPFEHRPQMSAPRSLGGQHLGISSGAAVSRGIGRTSTGSFRRCTHAGGGGSPNSSGTRGSAARNIVANSAGRSRLRWRAVRTTLARTCCVSAPLRVRLPPHTLADDDGGPDGLFGAPVGGVDRRVPEKGEDGGEFDGQVRGEALGVVQRRRVVDQPAEPGQQSAAGGGQTVAAWWPAGRGPTPLSQPAGSADN